MDHSLYNGSPNIQTYNAATCYGHLFIALALTKPNKFMFIVYEISVCYMYGEPRTLQKCSEPILWQQFIGHCYSSEAKTKTSNYCMC